MVQIAISLTGHLRCCIFLLGEDRPHATGSHSQGRARISGVAQRWRTSHRCSIACIMMVVAPHVCSMSAYSGIFRGSLSSTRALGWKCIAFDGAIAGRARTTLLKRSFSYDENDVNTGEYAEGPSWRPSRNTGN